MKIEQSRAERLADLIQSRYGNDINDAAAAELRRLYAENVLLHERHSFDTKEYSRLHALNAELLEALKFYLTSWDGGEVEWFKNCYDVEYKVRVAISKAEEQE